MKRILVCDDSVFIRKLIKRELESSYEVVLFNDGKEAYEHLKQDKNFDFAIIDGEMPNMTGWELIGKIKSELKLSELPVVILTATDNDFYEHRASDEGAFDYLKKPFKEGELYTYINEFFKGALNKGVVLVVEDSVVQNNTISHQLRLKHIKPISVFSGEEAIRELLKGTDVDTILLDINLPGASGFEVARALKQDTRFNWIPIIGITALEGTEKIETMKKAFASGVDDFISKPYTLIEFYARIQANIKRAKLTKSLKEKSELDYLTKIYNRRVLFKMLQHYFASSSRYGYPLSLLIMDIDHFKSVNDTYGHPTGDEVLKVVASRIKNSLRKADVLGRFGGEEFCVVMPHTDIKGACLVGEKIREAVNKHPIEVDGKNVSVTISVGATQKLNDDKNIDDMIKRADEELYRAKHEGRNRVSCPKKGETT